MTNLTALNEAIAFTEVNSEGLPMFLEFLQIPQPLLDKMTMAWLITLMVRNDKRPMATPSYIIVGIEAEKYWEVGNINFPIICRASEYSPKKLYIIEKEHAVKYAGEDVFSHGLRNSLVFCFANSMEDVVFAIKEANNDTGGTATVSLDGEYKINVEAIRRPNFNREKYTVVGYFDI